METQQFDLGERLEEFIRTSRDKDGNLKYVQQINEILAFRKRSLVIDFNDIYQFDERLATEIINSPLSTLPILEDRILKLLGEQDPQFVTEVQRVHLRLVNVPRLVELRRIRSSEINKIVVVEGILTKQTPIKERAYRIVLKHTHPECNAEFRWPEDEEMDETIKMPSVCPVCGKPGQFDIIPQKAELTDWQRVIIQERPEEVPPGQIPRQLEAVFEDDLVDSARPGDRVRFTGILMIKQDSFLRKGSRSIFDIYLKVINVEISQKVLDEVEITEEDRKKIENMAKNPWIREAIISSIAPSIYDHWEIKEAIALALFGGVSRVMEDGTRTRGDIHVLIIGDPGTAKSQILQFAARVSPRSVYTTGKGATAAGLTAAVVREKNTGDYYLEAGALVLADGGIAVIDEIDKMREEDRVAIHEAMEQQTVSIAKAGILAKLNARATIIAAGNPKFGRYIQERAVAENIELPPTILSRFDLIFILVDKPGSEDQNLANHILDMHGGKEVRNFIPVEDLKKYIAFARKFVNPKLNDEAKQLLADFYVEMRRKSSENPSSPILITPRQLEALIRITEAYARMALRLEATREDAERAINIMRIFLEKVGIDVESGSLDIDTIMTGKPKSAREKMVKIMEIIEQLSNDKGCAKLKEVVKEAEREGIEKSSAEKIISDMKKSGLIYEASTECFKKVS
ncbi:Minichromosome maintenance protein MCM [Metallosphaera sp. J1]|uniref:minichromosome maintenance protein MCM n=1 Tax=Metallosphaera TaxID=41980 RepID=UPI001EDFD6DD|nr:minichromosome maintenance protein MCM [Metallosphaera javensis (ex Hofmann et al. 2022)]MCG3108575.1 Minichromosome maintenance protein MCM [Metallosphaera javensis (ex Hofmann et al. 2022)]BCS91736.1 MAG: minichromosome maintenance protein MCM [Metallosphaera javensis (ex Sakai et al. 2022)]